MKTPRMTENRPIVLNLHPSQVEALDEIAKAWGRNRTMLIREAVAMLIGRYELAKETKRHADAKVA